MIISSHVRAMTGAYANQQNRTNAPRRAEERAGEAGEVVLSQTGQNFSSLLRRIKDEAGDVRQDRVAALEKQIAAGTYRVDAEKVAASLMAMRY
ncbi:MAG: flagellar biosynthesis anti-sigma factor FlgM [Schwartzia sp. (in: firmicutes)]